MNKLNADLYYCTECKCSSKNVDVVHEKTLWGKYTKAQKDYEDARLKYSKVIDFIGNELKEVLRGAMKLRLLKNSEDDISNFTQLNYPEISEYIWVDSRERGWHSWRVRYRRWIGLKPSYPSPKKPPDSWEVDYSVTCPICFHKYMFLRDTI